MRAYAIFQGGGAKGFAHVGALRAAEERGIRFEGVAGTSIGAVVAALVAVGYVSDELYAVDGRSPAGVLDIDPLEVIDESDWREIEAFQASVARFAARPMARLRDKLLNLWARQVPLSIRHRRIIARLTASYGMTGTEGLVAWIDRLLAAKVRATPAGVRVRFRDLVMPLRVVAADLVTGTTRIFGGTADADLAVADAVAASACYPGVFRPVAIGDGLFVDGGLVSNLPAWVFDAERGGDPGFVPTFGIRFVDAEVRSSGGRRGPSDFLRFARRLLDTAVSGASELESRGIDDYYPVDLAVDVPTLSFSGLRERAPAMIERGRLDVLRFFETTVGPQDPARIRRVLRVVALLLRRRLGVAGRVRAYVLMRHAAAGKARVFYSAGMDEDADDRMVLDVGDPGPASPLLMREPVLVRYRELALSSGGPHAKYERALRPSSVVAAYSLPIFDDAGQWLVAVPAEREEPYACLVIDAEEDLRPLVLSQEVEDLLAGVAQLVGEYVRDRHRPRPAKAPARAEDPASGWERLTSNESCLVSARKRRDPSDRPGTLDFVAAIERELRG
jgi:NTE family protein